MCSDLQKCGILFSTAPTCTQQSHQKKLSPKKGSYIYICRFWYKNKKLPYSEIPTVVKLGDVNENTTIVEFGILQITIEVNLKEPKVTQPNPD